MAHMKAPAPHVHGFRLNGNGAIVCIPGPPLPLPRQGQVHEWRVMSPMDKETIIARLGHLLDGSDDAHDFLRQRAALLVDEMIENALYAAPVTPAAGSSFIRAPDAPFCRGNRSPCAAPMTASGSPWR